MRTKELRDALEQAAGPPQAPTEGQFADLHRRIARQRGRRRLTASVSLLAVAAASVAVGLSWPRGHATSSVRAGRAPSGTTFRDHAAYLYAGPGTLRRIDFATGQATTISLPGLDVEPPYPFLVRGDHLVYWARTPDGRQPFATFSIPLDGHGPPRLLDHALWFLPSAHSDRIWLVYDTDAGVRRPAAVREITVEGTETVPRTPLPPPTPGLEPDRGVGAGLVLTVNFRQLAYWSPGRALRVIGSEFENLSSLPRGPTLDTTESAATFVDNRGYLHVTSVATGDERVYAPPPGTAQFVAGSFSPDTKTFAALAATQAVRWGTAERNVLVLIDLPTGKERIVPGSQLEGSGEVAWSRDGQHLAFTGYQPRLVNNIIEVRILNLTSGSITTIDNSSSAIRSSRVTAS